MKVSIIFLALSVLIIRPTPSWAWRGDHFRFGLDLSVPVGGYYYGGYYSPDYVYVSSPVYQPVVINGVTYYMNNGNYYVYTSYGYQLVSPPLTVVQSPPTIPTAPIEVATSTNVNTDDVFNLNIPNDKGGYTPVIIKRSGNGFIGPQGEFYSEFPKVVQLKVMYGK